jgi:hypothetical protein
MHALDLRETKLADYDASTIGHKAEDGSFDSQPRETKIYLSLYAHFFGVTLGDPRWNPSVDINVDGAIDVYDIVLIAGDFEETAQCFPIQSIYCALDALCARA